MKSQAERLAQLFHETYERLAPQFGYRTRSESAVPWEEVPEANRRLMVAVAQEIIKEVMTASLAEWCLEERDAGAGGCGACSICCGELRQLVRDLQNKLTPFDRDVGG